MNYYWDGKIFVVYWWAYHTSRQTLTDAEWNRMSELCGDMWGVYTL